MRRPATVLALVLCTSTVGSSTGRAAPDTPPWENPAVNAVNRLPAHARVVPYPDEALAASRDLARSPWYLSLNGPWKFAWSPSPGARPLAFFEPAWDDAAWATIPVPSNMEMHGYGVPIYVNTTYPWGTPTPPVVPREVNSVGSYRRRFDVPASWAGRRVVLTFDGVNSAFYVWVNGRQVGYSEDSRLPAEFDLTDSSAPERTSWRSRCTATRTAPIWSARTSGACRASSATSPSGPRRGYTCATSASSRTSTPSIATRR